MFRVSITGFYLLSLSFSFGLVCSSSALAFEFDKKLLAPDGAGRDFFGTSVSLDGNTALIGSVNYGIHGSAYLFDVITGNFLQVLRAPDIPLRGPGDGFGSSVSLDGNMALISSRLDDDLGISSGSAYLFSNSSDTDTDTDTETVPEHSSILALFVVGVLLGNVK